MNTAEYEQHLEAAFDAAALAPSRFKILSGESLRQWLDTDIDEAAVQAELRRQAGYESGPDSLRVNVRLNFDKRYEAMVAAKNWPAVNAMNDMRAKWMIAGKFGENELNAAPIEIEAEHEAPHPLDDKPKTKEPVTFSRRIGEILATPTNARWLERDILERGVLAVIASRRGGGKTQWAVDRVMHVALTLGEPVLCLWGEGNPGLRFEGWIKKHAPETDISKLPIYIITKRFDLNSVEGRTKVFNEMTRIKQECGKPVALCVTDTWSKWVRVQEKDNSEVSAALGGLDGAIRTPFDCTVLIVTHLGHGDQTRARGASAIEADTDAAYILERDPCGIVRVTRERFKDCAEKDPLVYRSEVIDLGRLDDDGVPATSIVLVPTKDAPKYQPKQQQPSGENQIAIVEAIKELCPFGDAARIDAVIDATLEKREMESTTEKRRDVRKALDKLAGKRLIWLDGEQCGPGAMKPANV